MIDAVEMQPKLLHSIRMIGSPLASFVSSRMSSQGSDGRRRKKAQARGRRMKVP